MKERILKAMQHKESVIFKNKLTGKLTFFNGESNKFEFISIPVFEELKKESFIKVENCICQGDFRYILAWNNYSI